MNFAELLRTLGRPADAVPPDIMQAAGWSFLATFRFAGVETPDVAALGASIDKAILAVWPDTVRMTCDQQAESLSLWRHPKPLPLTEEPFPSRLDVDHALRVLHAVGIARGARLSDERTSAIAHGDPEPEIVRLTDALNGEQALFEHLADLLGRYPEP